MVGEMQAGWYRRTGDAPHILRRVSGGGSHWITCSFDARVGAPCDGGGILSRDAWRQLSPVPAPVFAGA